MGILVYRITGIFPYHYPGISLYHLTGILAYHFQLIILTSHSDKIDWFLQKTSYINRYDLIDKARLIKTEVSDFILYWYGIEEFKMYLSRVGYKDISYQIGYGNEESEIITFIAYK